MSTAVQTRWKVVIRRPEVLAWGTVRTGLALNFTGVLLLFLGILVFTGIRVTQEAPARQIPVLTVVVQQLSLLGTVAGLVLATVGACMCSAAPRSAAKRWGYATCALTATSLVLLLVLLIIHFNATPTRGGEEEAEPGAVARAEQGAGAGFFSANEARNILYAGVATVTLAVACFVLSLQSIASHFRHRLLAFGVFCYFLLWAAFVGGVHVIASRPTRFDELDLNIRLAAIGGSIVLLAGIGLLAVARVRKAISGGMLHSCSEVAA